MTTRKITIVALDALAFNRRITEVTGERWADAEGILDRFIAICSLKRYGGRTIELTDTERETAIALLQSWLSPTAPRFSSVPPRRQSITLQGIRRMTLTMGAVS